MSPGLVRRIPTGNRFAFRPIVPGRWKGAACFSRISGANRMDLARTPR